MSRTIVFRRVVILLHWLPTPEEEQAVRWINLPHPDAMKAIFLTACLFCSLHATTASILPIPSNLTKVQYYTHIFSWNEAYDICSERGGSLLQPESRLEWDYYKSVIRDLSVMASREQFEVWLGMIVVNPGEATVVWVDGCFPVCHHQFPAGEPNELATDFCIRVVYESGSKHKGSATPEVWEWRTTACDNKVKETGFICLQDTGMTCSYEEHPGTALEITSDSVDNEVFDTSQTVCSQLCTSRTRAGLECWAFTFKSHKRHCTLYYLRDPLLLTREGHIRDKESVLMTKKCFQLEIRSDVLPSQQGNKTPSSPCFEVPVSTGCQPTASDPLTISVTSALFPTTAESEADMTSLSTIVGWSPGISEETVTGADSSTTSGKPIKVTTSRFMQPMLQPQRPAFPTTIETVTIKAATETLTTTTTETSATTQTATTTETPATTETLTTSETPATTETTKTTAITTTALFNAATEKPVITTTEAMAKMETVPRTETATTRTSAETLATRDLAKTTATPTKTAITTTVALVRASTQTKPTRKLCSCPCVESAVERQNITKAKFTENLIAALEINVTNLSSTRRKLISVYESRVVPMALGTCGLGILLTFYLVILLSDVFLHFRASVVQIMSDSKQ